MIRDAPRTSGKLRKKRMPISTVKNTGNFGGNVVGYTIPLTGTTTPLVPHLSKQWDIWHAEREMRSARKRQREPRLSSISTTCRQRRLWPCVRPMRDLGSIPFQLAHIL